MHKTKTNRIKAKFRKKTVEIEAIQWNRTNIEEVCNFYSDAVVMENCVIVKTLEGDMRASVGDYIIKGVKGEFYPCKPDIFEATYDKVD